MADPFGVLLIFGLLSGIIGSVASITLKDRLKRKNHEYSELMKDASQIFKNVKQKTNGGHPTKTQWKEAWNNCDRAAKKAHEAVLTLSSIYDDLNQEIQRLQNKVDNAREPEKSSLVGEIKPLRNGMTILKNHVSKAKGFRNQINSEKKKIEKILRKIP